MPGKRLSWLVLAALLLSGSGCCSFWERWHAAPACSGPGRLRSVLPELRAASYASLPELRATSCALRRRRCPAGRAPVANQWQRQF